MDVKRFLAPTIEKVAVFFVFDVILFLDVCQAVPVFEAPYWAGSPLTDAAGAFQPWAWLLMKIVKIAACLVVSYLLACIIVAAANLALRKKE